jgi:hypothetical protein
LPPLPAPADNAAMETEQPKTELPKRKRRWFQFSLRTLLIGVVAASLALAAMRYSTSAWTTGVVTVTILLLIASTALAFSSRIDRRPFWIGFAVCGWAYLVVIGSTGFVAPEFALRLATTKSVEFLRDKFHPPEDFNEPQQRFRFAPALPLLPSQVIKNTYSYQTDTDNDYPAVAWNFLLIGHCLWAIILATLGGVLARFAAGRSRAPSTAESSRR